MSNRKNISVIHEAAIMGSNGLIIDKDAGIIRNVKLLGFVSKNGRTYTPEAVKEAANLYEGVPVNADHGDTKTPRSIHDRLGRVINVRFVEGEGLFGDFEFLKSHPLSERIIEAAERLPESMGFSHYADGQVRKVKGVEEVYKITKVKSVDLVADPATCNSLSEVTMAEDKKKEDETHVDIVKGDHPVKEASMCEVCKKVKEALGDKDADDKGKMSKIKEAYGMKEGEDKLPADYDSSKNSNNPAPPKDKMKESDDKDADDKPKDKDPEEKKESVEVTRLKLTAELKELCESIKIKPDAELLEDLSNMSKDAAVRVIRKMALAEAVSAPKTTIPVAKAGKVPEKGLYEWLVN
jgi:hypothetical protein